MNFARRLPYLLLLLPALASAAPKGKAKKTPSASDPAPAPTSAPLPAHPSTRVEIAACPAEPLTDLDGEGVVAQVRRKCRSLRGPSGAAAVSIERDESIVAICIVGKEAVDPKTCELRAAVAVEGGGPGKAMALAPDGELAVSVRVSTIDEKIGLSSGDSLTLAVESVGWDADVKQSHVARAALRFRKRVDAYGFGISLWFPIAMLTTDFSTQPSGYRLGIMPVALASGFRWYPSSSSTYVGFSAFVGWNLLVPNDVTSLTASTRVKVNYEALGAGVLFDISGWVGLGVGMGHTFTTDARTDFRGYLYFGPRLLSGLMGG